MDVLVDTSVLGRLANRTDMAHANGLGLSPSAASTIALTFEAAFRLLEEIPAIYSAWSALVDELGIIGKQVHDARLAAVCHVHGVTHVLTFNVAHFTRLATAPPGLIVIDPMDI